MKNLKARFGFILASLGIILFLTDFSLVFAEEFRYDSHGKRDPFLSQAFQNLGESQLSHGELRLEGIVIDKKGQSYAIVNSEIVREGQTFQGFLLKNITSKEVTFVKGEEEFKVQLRNDDDLTNLGTKS